MTGLTDRNRLHHEIVKHDLAVKGSIKRIWDCNTSMDDLNQLNSLVVKQIQAHKSAIKDFEAFALEKKKPAERESLLSEVDGHKHQLETNYASLRKANKSSRKIVEEKIKEELWFSEENKDNLTQRKTANKSTLANEASGLTENLHVVSRMIAAQVSQSEQTLNSLVNSSATTTETHEEFKTQSTVITQSKKLLVKYGRREVTDKVLIFLALAFFFACVFYVIMKRIF